MVLERCCKLPPGHMRLHVWEHSPQQRSCVYEQEAAQRRADGADKHAAFGMYDIGEVTISETASVQELKQMVLDQLLGTRGEHVVAEQVRVRTVDASKRVKGVLRDSAQALKRCRLSHGGSVAVEVLQAPEQLSDGSIVLWCTQRLAEEEYARYRAACSQSMQAPHLQMLDMAGELEAAQCCQARQECVGGAYGKPLQVVFDDGPFPR